MSTDLGYMIEDLIEGRIEEAFISLRTDFREAFKGQTIVDVDGADGTFAESTAFQFEFANGTELTFEADPFSTLDVERDRRILGRKIVDTVWDRSIDHGDGYADHVLRFDVVFEDGEDWNLFEARGPKMVDLTGRVGKVETTD